VTETARKTWFQEKELSSLATRHFILH